MSGRDTVVLPLKDRVQQGCPERLGEVENGAAEHWRQFRPEGLDVSGQLEWKGHFSEGNSVKTSM